MRLNYVVTSRLLQFSKGLEIILPTLQPNPAFVPSNKCYQVHQIPAAQGHCTALQCKLSDIQILAQYTYASRIACIQLYRLFSDRGMGISWPAIHCYPAFLAPGKRETLSSRRGTRQPPREEMFLQFLEEMMSGQRARNDRPSSRAGVPTNASGYRVFGFRLFCSRLPQST